MRTIKAARQLEANRLLKVNGIYTKPRLGSMPLCALCSDRCGGQVGVEAAFIEERGPDPDFPSWFEIRVRCHGKEDYQRVTTRGRWHPDQWGTVISTGIFFQGHNERTVSGGASLPASSPPAPQATPLILLPGGKK